MTDKSKAFLLELRALLVKYNAFIVPKSFVMEINVRQEVGYPIEEFETCDCEVSDDAIEELMERYK